MKDFDAYWAEQEQKPIEFKIFGQLEHLPPSLPATMILKLIRLEKEYGKKDLPTSDLFDMGISIFGEGKIEEWCNKGLTSDQLTDLMNWAMEQYNPGNPAPPDQGAQTESIS